MPYLKAFLWRCLYAAVLVIVLLLVLPLIFTMVGVGATQVAGSAAFALIRIVGALLILLYIFFGPEPPALF